MSDTSGSLQSPGWPRYYPREEFRCVWIISPINVTEDMVLALSVNQTHFGTHGPASCPSDYLQFFDGNTTDAESMGKYCKFNVPDTLYTTTSQAMVVFQASNFNHNANRVGARVTFQVFIKGNSDRGCLVLCAWYAPYNMHEAGYT